MRQGGGKYEKGIITYMYENDMMNPNNLYTNPKSVRVVRKRTIDIIPYKMLNVLYISFRKVPSK